MFSINYEAWTDNEGIYNGRSKLEMITAITNFVNNSSKSDIITKEEINDLDEKALAKVGVQIYIADW